MYGNKCCSRDDDEQFNCVKYFFISVLRIRSINYSATFLELGFIILLGLTPLDLNYLVIPCSIYIYDDDDDDSAGCYL